MYFLTKVNDALADTPKAYVDSSSGFSRQMLIDRSTGSPHMGVAIAHLAPEGHLGAAVHSFEVSLYVLSGTVALTTLGSTTLLEQDHCAVIPIGTTYALRAGESGARWLSVSAPSELNDGRRQDTFFTNEKLEEYPASAPDVRDPRTQHLARFDAASMDLRALAGGSDVEAPTTSPSMATALLAYSGIGVKMLIDQLVGAQMHTMFVVDYQPTAIAHPHDHPFEETYVFVEGEVHALVDGDELILHPGDVLWAGVGADHGFENRSEGLVRWIELQAPQPPAQHSYRFSREWEHLARKLNGAG
ncbi:MAG TPA: cupin domain-containing protein [Acidimicrobiales bacterium]|jgi:quercetin dioxygenase-like cupin family protein